MVCIDDYLRCIVGIVTIDCSSEWITKSGVILGKRHLTCTSLIPSLPPQLLSQYEIMHYSCCKQRLAVVQDQVQANLHCGLGKRPRLGETRDLCIAITCRPSALTHDQFNALSFRCGRVLLEEGQVTQYTVKHRSTEFCSV